MKIIKLCFGLGLLAIGLYSGFASFPLWIIPNLGLLFTAGYIHSKWHLWKKLFYQGDRKLYQSLFVTYGIQVVVVLILYLLGSGVGRLLGL